MTAKSPCVCQPSDVTGVRRLIHPLSANAGCRRVPVSLFALCVRMSVYFSPLSSLFLPAWVNVRASCCSSQTTPWETDQPHRRGNPVFWLKERGKGGEERNFYASKPPLVSSSPSSLCIVARPWTMWPSSQALLWPDRRKRGGLQLLSRWRGVQKSVRKWK